ncbi:hypothetical protein D3C80_1882710 [compost metagenome]
MRSSFTLWLLLVDSRPFFSTCSSVNCDSRSVALLSVTSFFACKAIAPCSLCSVLPVTAISPSRAITVTPFWPLKVLPMA